MHMVFWLKDKNGKKPEEVFDNKGLATWLDKIISANIPQQNEAYRKRFLPNIDQCYEDELIEKASKFQNHMHTFRY